jgi:protein-S-isoprenylcysteine O-methyltransferase Ste14
MNRDLMISYGVWGLWLVSWLIAAIWSDRAAKRPALGAELLYRLVTLAGAVLMFSFGYWGRSLYQVRPFLAAALIALQVAGFAFCWWARLHLGRLWSGSITRKADHHVVDTGPYGLVRHPIYTGLDTAAIALAVLSGQAQVMVGSVLIILGCWIKAKVEEGWLRQELGEAAYDAYAARTPMLVPFWPKFH